MKTIPVLFEKKESCCGCSACMSICSKNAILMSPDDKGFLYPHIDSLLCVDCGLCKKVCPIQNVKLEFRTPDVYAVKHISDEVRLKSSSGGMFTAISDYILDLGGVVYGAAFDDSMVVNHERVTTKMNRDRLRGSKYVQSDLKFCFKSIKEDLENGKEVIFSGTPCQVAGLNNYLSGRITDKLFTVDIICHGTPSPKLFKDYLENIRSTYSSKVQGINFRNKSVGWRSSTVKIVLCDNREFFTPVSEDHYWLIFQSDIALRDSCYHCPFANFNRPSDITIGDFWGIEKSLPEFTDEKGVSLVLVNTEKGRKLFNNIEKLTERRSSNLGDCIQHNLEMPTIRSPKTGQFWNDYKKHGYKFISRKYGSPSFKTNLKKLLKSIGIFSLLSKSYSSIKNKI